MTEDDAIERFGLPAAKEDRLEVISLLDGELAKLPAGEADESLIKCLAAQLFSIGEVEDSLRIWQAKSASFDLMCGLKVQFLCDAGIEQTREYLAGHASEGAKEALKYLDECIAADDFAGWSPEQWLERTRRYYGMA
ncbi:MAG: hypothetical protein EOP83_17260 [Verrucomicrobiaceae bacterium]|nr:MAG: hypothetical protein EOP83_17260 [Verrucomicrobiaceae bacterium]